MVTSDSWPPGEEGSFPNPILAKLQLQALVLSADIFNLSDK